MRISVQIACLLLTGLMLSGCFAAGADLRGGGSMIRVSYGKASPYCVRVVNATPHTVVFQPAYGWTGITIGSGDWGSDCIQYIRRGHREELILTMVSAKGYPIATVYLEPDLGRYSTSIGDYNYGITISGYDRIRCHVDVTTHRRDRADCDVDGIR